MEIKDIVVGRMYRYTCHSGLYKDYIVESVDHESEQIVCVSKKGDEQTVLCADELSPLPYTTVGDLIDKLKKFDKNKGVDICISWYHGSNYCYAHKKRWDKYLDNGTRLYIDERHGTVEINNCNTEDYDMDED